MSQCKFDNNLHLNFPQHLNFHCDLIKVESCLVLKIVWKVVKHLTEWACQQCGTSLRNSINQITFAYVKK